LKCLIIAALEESKEKGDFTLSAGMEILAVKGKAGIMDIGRRFWSDTDDERAMGKAEDFLKAWISKTV
jgi:hypothetical protein